MKHLTVVAAIIQYDNKTLCVQRNTNKYEYLSHKYEFPGGKVELGESSEEALIREIKEELHMDIKVESHFYTVEHQYPDFAITMKSFLCSVKDDTLTLTEHIAFKWLKKEELEVLDWAAADIPIVDHLIK